MKPAVVLLGVLESWQQLQLPMVDVKEGPDADVYGSMHTAPHTKLVSVLHKLLSGEEYKKPLPFHRHTRCI